MAVLQRQICSIASWRSGDRVAHEPDVIYEVKRRSGAWLPAVFAPGDRRLLLPDVPGSYFPRLNVAHPLVWGAALVLVIRRLLRG